MSLYIDPIIIGITPFLITALANFIFFKQPSIFIKEGKTTKFANKKIKYTYILTLFIIGFILFIV